MHDMTIASSLINWIVRQRSIVWMNQTIIPWTRKKSKINFFFQPCTLCFLNQLRINSEFQWKAVFNVVTSLYLNIVHRPATWFSLPLIYLYFAQHEIFFEWCVHYYVLIIKNIKLCLWRHHTQEKIQTGHAMPVKLFEVLSKD